MMKKKMTLFDLVSMGVGATIGSGIFVMLGIGVAMTGRSVNLALIVAIFASFLMTIPAIFISGVAELKGGPVTQAAILLGKKWSSIIGYIYIIVNLTISVLAISIIDYLSQLIPVLGEHHQVFAVLTTLFFFLISIKGSKFMARAQNVFVFVLMMSLGLFILFGLPQVQPGYFIKPGFFVDGFSGFFRAVALLTFAAQGATCIINYSSEVGDSKSLLPKAMLITFGIVGLIYFGMGTVAAGVLPYEQVAFKSLGVVAKTILPYPLFIIFIIGGACFALGSTLNATLASLRYPVMQVAEDGYLPKIFLVTDKKYDYPYFIMGFFLLIGITPIVLNIDLSILVTLVMIPSYLFNLFIAINTVKIPKIYKEEWLNSKINVKNYVLYLFCILAAATYLVQAYFLIVGLSKEVIIGNFILFAVAVIYIIHRERQLTREALATNGV